ncbi:MAG: hypothetical protein K8R92_10295 [Planctomycetes bacterium]|nr:hypothetical protein [Planctomycetota bacterium]
MKNFTPGICNVSRRQAWQFAMVPLEARGNELHLMSTAEFAPRAGRFVRRVLLMHPCVRLVGEHVLRERLDREYGFAGGLPRGIRPGRAHWPSDGEIENGNSRI